MRVPVAVFAAVAALGAIGCGAAGPPVPIGAPPSSASAAPSPSRSPRPSYAPVDFFPTPVNSHAYPVCGFYTSSQHNELIDQDITQMMLAVAVGPSPATFDGRVTMRYEIDDADLPPGTVTSARSRSARFDGDGTILDLPTMRPSGASFSYVVVFKVLLSVYDTGGRRWVTSGRVGPWHAWFQRTHSIRVTLDPDPRFTDTNEHDNTLNLRVKTREKYSGIELTDNRCTVVS